MQVKQQLQEALEFTQQAQTAYEQEGHNTDGSAAPSVVDYDTAERLAISAVDDPDDDPHGTGLADTAAAARAAAARARAAARPTEDSSSPQDLDPTPSQAPSSSMQARSGAAGDGEGDDEAEGGEAAVEGGGAAPATVLERPAGRVGRNNARMHPNNKYYREEPDFAALAAAHPQLAPFLRPSPTPGAGAGKEGGVEAVQMCGGALGGGRVGG